MKEFRVYFPLEVEMRDGKRKNALVLVKAGTYLMEEVTSPITGLTVDRWMVLKGTMIGMSVLNFDLMKKQAAEVFLSIRSREIAV